MLSAWCVVVTEYTPNGPENDFLLVSSYDMDVEQV